MPTLLDIIDDARALEELLDELEGNVTGQENAVQAFLDETGDALTAKVDAYAGLIRQIEAFAATRKAEAKRMAELAKSDENRVKWLKERLLLAMDVMGETRIDGDRHRVSIAKNGGKVPVVVPDDVNALPDAFVRTVVRRDADKDAIREALERGVVVPGCRLGERGRRVSIK
jgi:hypothetical protein